MTGILRDSKSCTILLFFTCVYNLDDPNFFFCVVFFFWDRPFLHTYTPFCTLSLIYHGIGTARMANGDRDSV